jgi:hypothetical protein
VFRADNGRIADVIIDVSYRQFLLLMDHVEENEVARAASLGLFKPYPPTFVGSEADLVHRIFNLTRLRERHQALGALREPAFSSTSALLAKLFSKQMRDSLCGTAIQAHSKSINKFPF